MAVGTKHVPVEKLNRLLAAGQKRVDDLEPRLVDILQPILEQAGNEAASNFRAHATDHLTASALAADRSRLATLGRDGAREIFASLLLTASPGRDHSGSNSTMICVKPLPEEAETLAAVDGVPPDELHVTLAFLGPYDGDLSDLADVLSEVARSHAPLQGRVGGIGSFSDNGNGYPAILLPSVPGLIELRCAVTQALVDGGIDYGRQHGYLPHMTVSYEDSEMHFPSAENYDQPLHFDDLLIVRGDTEVVALPLDGMAPITAAGEPTPWSAPAPDELIDVDALTSTLRGKTDPVRKGAVEAIMTPALDEAGLNFDVTNPMVGKVLAQSGSQITEIAQTTQSNVMSIIKASHDQGLSIPATATAIQAGMADASKTRATLIARTELVGAVNGGSLAATQLVSDATGSAYDKVWLTAPGAQYPRHEDYPGLDEQKTTLDGFFTVGADQLQFPGDPDGDPGEICNCRCTMVYEDASGAAIEEVDAESGGGEVPEGGDEGDTGDEGGLSPSEANLTSNVLGGSEDTALTAITDAGTPEAAVTSQRVVTLPTGLSLIDDVSTGAGAPIETSSLAQVKKLGLDRSPEMLPASRDQFFAKYETEPTDRLTTELLYKVDPVWNPISRSYDGKWNADREALHQKIIADWFKDHKPPPVGTPLHYYFTAGGGASGKGSAKFLIERDGETIEVKLSQLMDPESEFYDPGTIVIDPDLLKQKLPEYGEMRDRYDPAAAATVHEESSMLAKEIARLAQGNGYNIGLDSTGSGPKFIQKIQAAKDAGYETQVTLVSTPTNLAIDRSIARAENEESDSFGRYVQVDPLKNAHRDASAAMNLWQNDPVIDSYRVFDNQDGMKLVASGQDGVLTVKEPETYQSILDKRLEPDPYANPSAAPEIPTIMPTPPPLSQGAMYDTLKSAEWDHGKFDPRQIEPTYDLVSKIHPDDRPGGLPAIHLKGEWGGDHYGSIEVKSAGRRWSISQDGKTTALPPEDKVEARVQANWAGVMQERVNYSPRVLPTPESLDSKVTELGPDGYAQFQREVTDLAGTAGPDEKTAPWKDMLKDINEAVREGYLNQDGNTDTILVARDSSGKMIGAMAVQSGEETEAAWTKSEQTVPVGRYLSVMRIAAVPGAPAGTGSMLMRQAAEMAAEQGLGVLGASLESAATFYARIGMHVNEGIMRRYDPPIWWTNGEAAAVAKGQGIVRELPNPETVEQLTGVQFARAE